MMRNINHRVNKSEFEENTSKVALIVGKQQNICKQGMNGIGLSCEAAATRMFVCLHRWCGFLEKNITSPAYNKNLSDVPILTQVMLQLKKVKKSSHKKFNKSIFLWQSLWLFHCLCKDLVCDVYDALVVQLFEKLYYLCP